MRDALHIVTVTLTDATRDQIRRGLIGFLVIELAGGLVIEGATLRRSRTGVRSVSFPRNRKGYPYIWLRTLAARQELERQVFEKLGVRASDSASTATQERRP